MADHLEHPRSILREQARRRAKDRCEWPRCAEYGDELAHLHSIGAGGRPSADTLGNVAWLCWSHARISDGELAEGGRSQFDRAHRDLLGVGWEGGGGLGWRRAEALAAIVAGKEVH